MQRFPLSPGCQWGEHYWIAHCAGLVPDETQIPWRTPVACPGPIEGMGSLGWTLPCGIVASALLFQHAKAGGGGIDLIGKNEWK